MRPPARLPTLVRCSCTAGAPVLTHPTGTAAKVRQLQCQVVNRNNLRCVAWTCLNHALERQGKIQTLKTRPRYGSSLSVYRERSLGAAGQSERYFAVVGCVGLVESLYCFSRSPMILRIPRLRHRARRNPSFSWSYALVFCLDFCVAQRRFTASAIRARPSGERFRFFFIGFD